ncbi:MAG: DUF1552 domain-containing protein [Myxococcales bacterium]|nr:DUF1552 domain-containing protein [Myxococcales bacterium]MDH3843252.1 DUF1552 domain-containing protein [Myxococcales bacterium]
MKGPKFSRRLLLGGAGAVVGLPLFESLIGDAAYADDSFPARLICYYVPNGMHMAAWTPSQTGSNYQLSPILQPLAPVQDQILVLGGLSNTPAQPDGPGDHAGGTSGFLTSAHANKSETQIQLGISMDQVIANQIGDATRIRSMQIGTDGGGNSGGCDSGYSCAYTRNISWASDTQPLSKTTNPGVVFNQIFDGTDPTASIEEQERRKLYKTSVLDYVQEQTQALEQKLGYYDRVKLDEYTTGVFELEQRLEKAGLVCGASEEPSDTGDIVEKVRIMNDLMVLALQCDATRVITFMLGNAGSNRSYAFLGANDGHHNYSHHQGNPANHAALQAIDTWEVEQLSYLLQRMNEVPEGTGTLLQHSQVFFSSEIEDGDAHRHRNLPVILAGSCHGAYNTGRHIDYEPNKSTNGPPIANLFLSMMAAMGVNQGSFGNSTGSLGQLG